MIQNPETRREVAELYSSASMDDQEAMQFLLAFDKYIGDVEAFLADPEKPAGKFITLLAETNITYSSPFYVRHAMMLHTPVLLAINSLAEGRLWDDNPEAWKAEWAKRCKLIMPEIVTTVAMIKGGFLHARKVSPRAKELAWASRVSV